MRNVYLSSLLTFRLFDHLRDGFCEMGHREVCREGAMRKVYLSSLFIFQLFDHLRDGFCEMGHREVYRESKCVKFIYHPCLRFDHF